MAKHTAGPEIYATARTIGCSINTLYAAPELLEALKLVVATTECGCHLTNKDVTQIKQALSKAEEGDA